MEDEADIIPGYEDETPPPVMPVGHREHANSQHARSEGRGEMIPRTVWFKINSLIKNKNL